VHMEVMNRHSKKQITLLTKGPLQPDRNSVGRVRQDDDRRGRTRTGGEAGRPLDMKARRKMIMEAANTMRASS
jgi:hypothetical protein